MTLRTTDPSSQRRTVDGLVIGSREPDRTHAWRGVPFARPPVGELRWRAPQPVKPWTGAREALEHSPMAPQYAGLLAPVPAKAHGTVVGKEDCLTLNVFAPVWATDQIPRGSNRRPVMVWIHGGGNAVGTAASYDVARNYAARDGLVVVTVNYRLGVLGWFTHDALHEADSASAQEQSGNFGTLDLIAALQWVRANISEFGGDPGNVTIFGESAGGQHVLTLLASPLAAGLFHRAIAQSPVAESFSWEEAMDGNDGPFESLRLTAKELTVKLWAQHSGEDHAAARKALSRMSAQAIAGFLRSLTAEQLLASVTPGSVGIYLGPRPVRDGVVLPKATLPEVFKSGQWNKVPVILGSNRDEYRTFLADKPEHARLLFGKLPILRNRAAYSIETSYLSDAWRALHVDRIADAMLESGHRKLWTYRFDWDQAPAIPFIRPDILLGACHGMEMPFAFRDVEGQFDIFKVNTIFNRAGRTEVADAMGDAWTSFASFGAPRLTSGQVWSSRTALADVPDSFVFNTRHAGGMKMAHVRTSIDAIKQRLMTASDMATAKLRCQIYARLFLWSPLARGHGSNREYAEWCKRFDCQKPPEAFRPCFEI